MSEQVVAPVTAMQDQNSELAGIRNEISKIGSLVFILFTVHLLGSVLLKQIPATSELGEFTRSAYIYDARADMCFLFFPESVIGTGNFKVMQVTCTDAVMKIAVQVSRVR